MDLETLRANIDTIFVVMLENRSFDHVFGSRYGFVKLENASGLTLVPQVPQIRRDTWIENDQPHARAMVKIQLENRTMRGFVKAWEAYNNSQAATANCPPMWICAQQDLPVTNFLADNYLVCKRWHAALPTSTMPNRLMAISGMSRIDETDGLLPDQFTTLDWMRAAAGPESYEVFVDHAFVPQTAGFPTQFCLMPNQELNLVGRTHHIDDLGARMDAWGDAPPGLVYCEPFYNDVAKLIPGLDERGNCNHPPLPMAFGEQFLAQVYNTIAQRPARFARSIIVVYYDEHGGFFDSAPPPPIPYAEPAGSKWKTHVAFDSLGVRVPAIIVSPWVEQGVTDHLFDHTSVLQLIMDRFPAPAGSSMTLGETAFRATRGIENVRNVLANTARAIAPLAPAAPTVAPAPPNLPDDLGPGSTLWKSYLANF